MNKMSVFFPLIMQKGKIGWCCLSEKGSQFCRFNPGLCVLVFTCCPYVYLAVYVALLTVLQSLSTYVYSHSPIPQY